MKKQWISTSAMVAAILLSACGGEAPQAGASVQPARLYSGGGAQTSAQQPGPAQCALPASGQLFAARNAALLGFDQARLDAAIQFGERVPSVSIRVYRHGCLAGKSGLDPASVYVPQPLFSGSKTVVSLAVGRAVTMGYLQLDDPIGTYLPQADAAHGAITVRQLLNQTSGLQLVLADEAAALTADPVQYTLALPSWYAPGTEFMYAQNTLTTLSRVLERATGQDFQAFVQQQLMARVGIARDHWVWLRDRSGTTFAWGGLLMRPDDEARLGHLMLNNGKWGTDRLISNAYMEQATTGTAANPGHGFLLWLNAGDQFKAASIGRPVPVAHPVLPGTPRDTYASLGAMGQMTVVVPSRDLVFVRNGPGGADTVEGKDVNELVRLVVAAVADMPQITDPGPYDYAAPAGAGDLVSLDNNLADWRLVGTLLGVGTGATPGCNLLLCNGRNLVADAGGLGLDAVQQLLAAVAATAADLARSLFG
ncbi:MAG: serine hydrolase domain-containing protein [Pseudomonadota bacterium]